jgi:catechol 2,3-dioxygenase-like lactoylglutathione lyase family enzyme
MAMALDHIILQVSDRDASIAFYRDILGFEYVGEREPFSVIRVAPDFAIQLAPWGSEGGEHLAFSLSRDAFAAALRRIDEAGLDYGDSFHAADNRKSPGDSEGARGPCKSLYCLDPSRHLIELLYYE